MKISVGELFYYLFWCLMLLVKGIGWYDGMPVYKVCLLLAIFCIGMKLCFTEHTVAEWIFIVLLSGLGLIAYANSGEKGILLGIMMIIGIKGVPLKRLFQVGLAVWGSCFAVMNVLGVFDIVTGPIFAQDKTGLGIVLRKSLGYTHPNVLHVTYAVLAAFILYLSVKKSIWKYLLLFLGNFYIFLYSFSYTGFMMVMLLLSMDIYVSRRKEISKPESLLLQSILPACMIFSVVGPMFIDKNGGLFRLINKIMNVRFFASHVFMTENRLSALGARNVTEGWALDSSYVSLLLHYGVVFFLLFFLLFFAVVQNCIKQRDRKGLALTVSFLIGGVIEPFLVNTSFKNLSWLIAGSYLYNTFFRGRLFSGGNILSCSFVLLRRWDRMVQFPAYGFDFVLRAVKSIERKWKKRCLIFIAAVGILAGMGAYFLILPPDAIYIGMQNTELEYVAEEHYLDLDNLPDRFRGVVYAYQGPESPLFRIGKEQLYFDRVRKSVSLGIGLAGATLLLLLTVLLLLRSDTGLKRRYVNYKWRRREVRCGEENPDKIFYVIRRSTGNTGLFSYVMTNMGHVGYALKEGYIPVIDMRNNKNTYLYDEEVGKVNAWELFFEQPGGYSLNDIAGSRNVILSNGIVDGRIPYPSMEMIRNESYLAKWRDIFRNYFIIKPEIEEEINEQYKTLFAGKKILGVLCRGTDYINARPPSHPVQPPPEELLDKAEEIMKAKGCDLIYLATEDEEVHQLFKARFPGRLTATAARRYRSDGNKNINDIIENEGGNKYQQGKEYLINIALLSRCDCLAAGCVGGTYGALLMSKGYEYQYIFDLGLY